MNDAIIIQQAYDGIYPPGDFRPMLELTRSRNEAYCARYGFDLEILIGVPDEKYSNPFDGQWCKPELIKRALDKGYQYVMWLDADALIADLATDLRDAFVDGIGVCWQRIPQLDHWNTGVMYVRNTYETRAFIVDWLNHFPGGKQWMEQGIFNQMGMKSKVVQTISDRWNATLNYSMVPDAVVLGYHGAGEAEQRLKLMTETLKTLNEKTVTVPGPGEVSNEK